jgi:poly(hydroxyalkanoate) depolymerase family esterase
MPKEPVRPPMPAPAGPSLRAGVSFESMAVFSSAIVAVRHIVCGSTAAAIILLAALALADAAEPREETGFGSNPGNLRMFSHVPAGYKKPSSLIIVLHGCKQKAATFARDAGWLELAESAKVALLLPEQKGLHPYLYDVSWAAPWVRWFGANNQNACFNWFEPRDTVRDRGEALSIIQMIDMMIARYSVDRSLVYIAGLSAGGAMTAVMLALYPERFAGGAIVAGVPFGCADTLATALRCMNPGTDRTPEEWRRRVREAAARAGRFPRISVWHGDGDARVVPRNRIELVEQWTAAHDIPATPPHSRESNEIFTRDVYTDAGGIPRVESVLVKGLGHAFPISTGGDFRCGQPGDFVLDAKICATTEIARFWGLIGAK